MAESWMILVDALTVVFAGFAAAFSWEVYKHYRILGGGIYMPLAFTFLVLNRLVIFSSDAQLFQEWTSVLKVTGIISFFLFSFCLFYGLWRTKSEGEEFMRSDKRAMKAIAAFEKRRLRNRR